MIARKVCPNLAQRSKILLECNSVRDLQPAESSFLEKLSIEINTSNKFQQSSRNGKIIFMKYFICSNTQTDITSMMKIINLICSQSFHQFYLKLISNKNIFKMV